VASLRLTPEAILATARYATVLSHARDEAMSPGLIRDAARLLSAGAGSGKVAAPPPSPPVSFDDLVLPDHVLTDLQRLVRWATHRDQALARGPVHGKGGKGTGITSLFTGGPGTGKTLAAHVVADELNLELFQIDLSGVIDKYIGETEKNLERIFNEAESRNVVLFFDEADALFGSRSEVKDARDRYANQEVSYLLQRMEHFDGITVLATNLRGNLDAAFSRRMQFVIHFPDPDAATRERLWRHHVDEAGELDQEDRIDVQMLAEIVELTGGDIRNIVLAATYDAAADDVELGMRQIRAATIREYRKLGRRPPAGFES
jgi:SpoVK/Ycf46/Vps4 family AAA+-type ATPase